MKVKLVETLVREAVVEVKDSTKIVEVFQGAGEAVDAGGVEFTEPKSIQKTITEVYANDDTLLMTQQMGRTLFTMEGAQLFEETREQAASAIAAKRTDTVKKKATKKRATKKKATKKAVRKTR